MLYIEKLLKGVNIVNEGKLKAVHDDDLEKLLESLGCLDKIIAGEYKCDFCGTVIKTDNISAVFPKDGAIHFCCSDEKCYDLLMKMGAK